MLKNIKRLLTTSPSSSEKEWNVYMRYRWTGPPSCYKLDTFISSRYIDNFITDPLFIKEFKWMKDINLDDNSYIHFVLQRSGNNIEGLGACVSENNMYKYYRKEIAESNYKDIYTEEFYKDIQYSMIIYKLKNYNKPINIHPIHSSTYSPNIITREDIISF